ncbi:MAG: hypothetical protein IT340_04895 [Chloroflexi bacterium]|nr:hypothetical protein [Chloroflexota bacterium]
MWKWKHFDSLDGLLQFVNERELGPDDFKVVNSPAPRRTNPYGAPMYLVYREHPVGWRDTELAAALPLEAEQESAIDAAEQILHHAADEGRGPRGVRTPTPKA